MDDGIEGISNVDPCSRGREVARGVLRSTSKSETNGSHVCHKRGIDNNRSPLLSTQQRGNAFLSDARPAPAAYHRVCCEGCEPNVGQSP